MRMLHLGLRVTDLERSLAFYTALGYVELGRVPATAFGSLTMLKLPDDPFASLELVHDPARPVTDTVAVNHLVVQTDDLDATIAGLAARGVTAEPPEELGPGLRTSWLTDPDGYRIELVQWPDGHPAGMTVADFEQDDATA
ncbi:MAG: VOC family protein [Actinomycetota bacterium]|nr:VOC family protein [Actinomycetota bacterium]